MGLVGPDGGAHLRVVTLAWYAAYGSNTDEELSPEAVATYLAPRAGLEIEKIVEWQVAGPG